MADKAQAAEAGFLKKYAPTIALVWTVVTGLASVSTQLSLVINTLSHPPSGSFAAQQAVAGGLLDLNFTSGSGEMTELGQIAVPPTGAKPTYVTVNGTGPFNGGSITFRNGDGSTLDGIYRPFDIIDQYGFVYACTVTQSTPTSAMSADCLPQQPALAYTLVVLSFIREAMIMFLWGLFVYNKSWLKKKIDMLAKNSIVGSFWFSIALTQEEFRQLQKEKKLMDLPKWFKAANTVIDLAATNIAVAMSSLNVKAYSASGKPLPGSAVTMLVFGGISGVGAIVQGGLAAKKWWQERKGGKQYDVPL